MKYIISFILVVSLLGCTDNAEQKDQALVKKSIEDLATHGVVINNRFTEISRLLTSSGKKMEESGDPQELLVLLATMKLYIPEMEQHLSSIKSISSTQLIKIKNPATQEYMAKGFNLSVDVYSEQVQWVTDVAYALRTLDVNMMTAVANKHAEPLKQVVVTMLSALMHLSAAKEAAGLPTDLNEFQTETTYSSN